MPCSVRASLMKNGSSIKQIAVGIYTWATQSLAKKIKNTRSMSSVYNITKETTDTSGSRKAEIISTCCQSED